MWTIGGVAVTSDNQNVIIQPDGSLLILGLLSTNCVVYTCIATNPLNSVNSSVTICGESTVNNLLVF